VITRL